MLKFLDYLNEQFFDSKKMIYVYENNKIAKVSNIKEKMLNVTLT